MARREAREYREYFSAEQRRQPRGPQRGTRVGAQEGCPARELCREPGDGTLSRAPPESPPTTPMCGGLSLFRLPRFCRPRTSVLTDMLNAAVVKNTYGCRERNRNGATELGQFGAAPMLSEFKSNRETCLANLGRVSPLRTELPQKLRDAIFDRRRNRPGQKFRRACNAGQEVHVKFRHARAKCRPRKVAHRVIVRNPIERAGIRSRE